MTESRSLLVTGHAYSQSVTSVRLGYRIVQLPPNSDPGVAKGVELGRYYDVERAMEDMKREFRRRIATPPNWYLLAPNQEVLLGPNDFLDEED